MPVPECRIGAVGRETGKERRIAENSAQHVENASPLVVYDGDEDAKRIGDVLQVKRPAAVELKSLHVVFVRCKPACFFRPERFGITGKPLIQPAMMPVATR